MTQSPEHLCRRCGYNLFGLSADAKCPECGSLVEDSPAGDRLANADPTWLQHLLRGQRRLIAGTILLIAVHVSLVAIAPKLKQLLTPLAFDLSLPMARLVCQAWMLVGILELTRAEPRLRLTEQILDPRVCSRTGAILAIFLVPTGGDILRVLRGGGFQQAWLGGAYYLALLLTIACVTLYLAELAHRLPDRELGDTARHVGKGLAVSGGLFVAGRAVADAISGPSIALGVLNVVIGLSGIVVFCYLARTLFVWWTFCQVLELFAGPRGSTSGP